ncbi:MAG: hypothetical protein WCB79_02700 [Halobacteriota archaeon]
MKKQAAMIAICAALLMCVAAAGCTSSTSPSPNAAATANSSSHAATANSSSHAATANSSSHAATASATVPATPSAKAVSGGATKLIDIQSSKTGDLYVGDQVVTTGRLVDANGNGIPNQQVTFMASVPIEGTITQGSATTDSTGAFQHVNTVSTNGAPAFLVSTITVTGWIAYAGNGDYQPTSSPHVPVTVHLK